MVSEYASPGTTKYLSYITGKCSRPPGLMYSLALTFLRLAHLPRMAGSDGKFGISRSQKSLPVWITFRVPRHVQGAEGSF